MDLSLRAESSMAKGLWKVLKIVPTFIWKGLKSKWKLERNAGKAFNVNFGLQDFEFSCKSSITSNPRFELAKNRRPCFPCISVHNVIEDYLEDECYPCSNREMVISITCTPTFIQSDRQNPLYTPFQISTSSQSSDNEVDRRSEEFVRWFHTQFLKIQSEASRGIASPKYPPV